jgi:phosphate transport system protein
MVIRKHYVNQLEEIREEVLSLGQSVEQSLTRAVHSLQTQNAAVVSWVIENDSQIDEARRLLEERAIKILATQQPVLAQDLRLLAVVSAIATELERIGDYARHIARHALRHPTHMEQIGWPDDINRMTERVQQMLHTSLEAFFQGDADMANNLKEQDDEVDELRDRLHDQFFTLAHNNEQYLSTVIDMIDVVNLLERTADRTTNIGERVVYIATSEVVELNE